ncbi:MAG: glycine dehydrogenase (aminomethyl-transferring) [Spirochaetaceae bacterium]|nr:MAG: glycine dehydrogenase (aminomethyl-transferring) [Spirochaetaceae bacterium]
MHAQRTSLYQWHASAGARFTSFAGWEMPVQYQSGALQEHLLTRNSVGIFDISHMGQVYVHGPSAADWLGSMVSADIARLAEGMSSYALLCREDGGVIDDLFVYRLSAEHFLIAVNAARRERDVAWLTEHLPARGATMEDRSADTAMIAVQGPRSATLVAGVLGPALIDLPRFGITTVQTGFPESRQSAPIECGRTGYTGEDGFELFLPAEAALACWTALFRAADELGVSAGPVGLAARDTLRLESGFPLYGHELTEDITAVEARLLWACDLEHDFIGRDAILKRKQDQPARTLRRLVMSNTAVPREGYPVLDRDEREVGVVVSGGPAPSAGGFVANAYVDRGVAADEPLLVRIRQRIIAARQNRGPVYKPTYRSEPAAGALLDRHKEFARRHIGPDAAERAEMLKVLSVGSMDELIAQAVPDDILRSSPPVLPTALTEEQLLERMKSIAGRNRILRSLIGMGYADTITPPVIQRNILESPGWYTQYTPYQAEISQGRLEALLNFQTMITELTGMDISNSSMLDEATAAAEAMMMALRNRRSSDGKRRVWLSPDLHPQTIAHLQSRAEPFDIEVLVAPDDEWDVQDGDLAGILQYPTTAGVAHDYRPAVARVKTVGALVIVATDILALTLLTPPGEWGADIVVGNSQRFGVPMGFGGPHAAFLAAREAMKRLLPGRLVGVSHDRDGRPAMRLSLQTREQHIRRDKATSNICTAQVLLAIMASMYAVYHGPDGLRRIALRITVLANALRDVLRARSVPVTEGSIFDTVTICVDRVAQQRMLAAAAEAGFNLRAYGDGKLGITLDEKSDLDELQRLTRALGFPVGQEELQRHVQQTRYRPQSSLERSTTYLGQSVFNTYHSETALLRYMTSLQSRDLSLTQSMISLGSCTMKLNPTAAMVPITWPEFAALHPYAPSWQAGGYRIMIDELSAWLCDITGFHGCTLQPNSGAHGEFTGLMIIRSWHKSRGEGHRRVCLVPDSAHGTNPASAIMAGMDVVVVNSAANGDIDLEDLTAKAAQHSQNLAALMVTYPSTHGVFERGIREAIRVAHDHGAQVYMDGANMNAQVGITSPGDVDADVCHLNLHKTFAIPHGGGGPGVGPVLTAEHLTPFLPGTLDNPGPTGLVVGAPFGSVGVVAISYGYIAMMGTDGLRSATEHAILNANYIAERLRSHIAVAFTDPNGRVAHECILDFRAVEKEVGVTVEDIAKRLADYGFHAPTMSWPVHGSLMVEPTESENKAELDRFCHAMISIMGEVEQIRNGEIPLENSPLRNAPHTLLDMTGTWDRPYSRETAAFPAPWCRENKFWPAVSRIDNVHGDRHLVCSCAPLEAYRSEEGAAIA